jgi:hypothetical protein
VDIVAKATTVTELKGIRIADRSGVSWPVAAKEILIRLYRNEIAKPVLTIFKLVRENRIILGNLLNFSESRMASQAGEKW